MDPATAKLFFGFGLGGAVIGWMLVVEWPAMRRTFAEALDKVVETFKAESAAQRKQADEQNAKILDAALNRKKD